MIESPFNYGIKTGSGGDCCPNARGRRIGSIKTTSMEDVSTRALEKIKNI